MTLVLFKSSLWINSIVDSATPSILYHSMCLDVLLLLKSIVKINIHSLEGCSSLTSGLVTLVSNFGQYAANRDREICHQLLSIAIV